MRGCSALIALSLVSVAGVGGVVAVAGPAVAQESGVVQEVAQPPINAKDIGNYCIYASRIYSSGAQICVARGSVTLGCEKGEWKVDLTKFGLDCRNELAGFRPGEMR